MMQRGIKNKLTKTFILERITQEEIFAKYLQINIEEIRACVNSAILMYSPLRIDNRPSLGFKYNNKGKLRAKDFGGYFWGDCFDLVAYILSKIKKRNYNVNQKGDFYDVLKNIEISFYDKLYNRSKNPEIDNNISNALNTIKRNKHIIEIIPRDFNSYDMDIWRKWHLTISDLRNNNIYAVDQYFIDRYCQPESKYYYTKRNPCYCYLLGIDNEGIYNIELYFPLAKKTDIRFITNCNIIHGIYNIKPNTNVLIILEAYKDNVAIDRWLNEYISSTSLQGDVILSVINYPSASYRMTNVEYDYIKRSVSKDCIIVSFFDFDRAGRMAAKHLKDNYNIPYLFITNGELGLPSYNAKDFCELLEEYSAETINNFIKQTFKLWK